MGKTKTKNRGGGSGAQAPFLLLVNILKSTKDTTTLVATDTRTYGTGAPELNVYRAEMLGTMDEVDEIAEIEEDSEKESDSISRTLEEYDSESTISNRLPSVGSKLELSEREDGPIPIDEDEVQLSWNTWQFCLVGYFGGRFSGKMALKQIMDAWRVKVKAHHHNSGWIVFQFESEDIQMKVLENGPYMIYGRPLMLKVMSQTFNFKKEEISHFPAWVQLRNLPLSLWGPSVLSKICSRIGKPVYMDKLTTHSERISFCPLCKVVGHSEEGCQAKKSKAKNISVEPTKNAEVSKVTKVGTSLSSMTMKGQGSQQEWVTKKSKTTRNQTYQTVKVLEALVYQRNPWRLTGLVFWSRNQFFHLRELGSGEAVQNSSLVTVLPEQQFILSDKAVHPQHQQVDGVQQQVLEVQEHTKGILEHLKKNNVDILRILETKLKHQRIKNVVRKKFNRWKAVDNFQSNPNGRILIFWREDKVELDIIESSDQVIHCLATWDFNSVLSGDEKLNGNPVTSYEVRDFQNCCYELGITDLRFSGVLHTWSSNSVWSKLDMAMVNEKWGQEGISAFANFGLPRKYSDHSPCVVSLFGNNVHGASSFKFFNTWAHHANFLELVGISWSMRVEGSANSWSMRVEGSAMFRLCKKLKALKGPLRTLKKLHYSHISARAQAAEDDLLEAQQLLHDNRGDDSLQSKVVDLRGKACRLAEAEISFCSQLAKAKYLKNCDKGTKFFHDLIKNNRARNQVVSLTKSDGVVTTFPQQVSSLFVEYYENFVGTRNNVLRLDSRVLTDGARVEDEQALALTRPVLDEDIKVEDFRPIACCNVVYKVISKILAMRLSPILEILIDPAQSAFIPNRSMVENIYLVQELLRRYGWSRISPRCIMKIDLRKAYDTVNWTFLEDVLLGLGFPPMFMGWIMQCVTTTSYSISINGSLHGFFKGQKDDLILFARGDVPSVSLSMDCLKHFGDVSGLCINASIPVAASRLSIEQFSPLISRISEHISSWAGAYLSYAGKSELIRSVLQGVDCFWLSILPIPVGVRQKVIALCEGGLGFIELHAWNLALLSKSFRNLQSKKDSLWVKWMNQVYIRRDNFWDYVPAKQDSQMVRQLADIRDKVVMEVGSNRVALDTLHNLKERLLTRDKLADHIEDTSCVLCGAPIESIHHLFFQCPIVSQVWEEIKGIAGLLACSNNY
ncbi:hypothetical protein Acr_23g0015130 [Actinidia rufa]|uniref:Reverse transcriptase domain-containing protein n=1 Tax=Actinidia rufa TaxID=165716 RepID=A0A7J0GQU5_9ERIC|nr:hypothetical protein Acr_23g0015130 [Actinidia rufa]